MDSDVSSQQLFAPIFLRQPPPLICLQRSVQRSAHALLDYNENGDFVFACFGLQKIEGTSFPQD